MKSLTLMAALSAALLLAGCSQSADDNLAYLDEAVTTLERANYSGQFNLSTDGKAGVGSTQSFWIGPPNAQLSVNGQVNFAEGE